MTLQGQIHNGVVVFTVPVPLPEGTLVRVEPVTPDSEEKRPPATLLDALGDVVGSIDDLPADAARNHDRYLYVSPRL